MLIYFARQSEECEVGNLDIGNNGAFTGWPLRKVS